MGLGSLHHIGIVVPELGAALRGHIALAGGQVLLQPRITQDGTAIIAFIQRPAAPLLEVIQPLEGAADLHAYLDRNPGGGLHHLCYRTPDIRACRDALAKAGMRFATPIVTGILGHPIFFVEAAVAGGILTELIELPEVPEQDGCRNTR